MKKIITYMLTILTIICLSACKNSQSDGSLMEILKENGYSFDASTIESTIDLNTGIQGPEESIDNKLILVNNNGYYSYVIVNTKTKSLVEPAFGYTPLNVVQQEIWNMDKDTNIKCIHIFKNYIEQYGVNCLESKEYAEEYLREITGENSIISTDKAQNIVSNSTMKIFPDIESNDEVVVLFEENTAVPLYYATQSTTLNYNWSSMWSEYHYNNFVRTSLTQTQLSAIASVYGPPYSEKLIWNVVDSDFKKVGTYDSLQDVKTKLLK